MRPRASRIATTVVTCALTVAGGLVLSAPPAAADDFGLPGTGTSNVSLGTAGTFGTVTLSSASALVDTTFSLADLDPVSGSVISADISGALTGAYSISADVQESSLLALDTAELARQAQERSEAARRAQEAANASSSGVGPDGCPTTTPANTLRDGSQDIGIATLCADSVAQARTPEAARAIKFQLNNLGVPYSQPNRMKDGYFDCSSFAMRSYTAGGLNLLVNGWAPATGAIRTSAWAIEESLTAAEPGDLLFPTTGHVATLLADGYISHTNRPGDVSHVRKAYTSVYKAYRVDPTKA